MAGQLLVLLCSKQGTSSLLEELRIPALPQSLFSMNSRAIGLRGILTISMSFKKLPSLEKIVRSLCLANKEEKKVNCQIKYLFSSAIVNANV